MVIMAIYESVAETSVAAKLIGSVTFVIGIIINLMAFGVFNNYRKALKESQTNETTETK